MDITDPSGGLISSVKVVYGPTVWPPSASFTGVKSTAIWANSPGSSSLSPLSAFIYGADSFADDLAAYDNMARAIAAYERSAEVTRFTSKFDTGTLNAQELRGKKLFMQNCTTCHAYGRRGGDYPLFTNYKYVNAGVPVNPALEADPNCAYEKPDLGLGPVVGDPARERQIQDPHPEKYRHDRALLP